MKPKPPMRWKRPTNSALRRERLAGGLPPPAFVRNVSAATPRPAAPGGAWLLGHLVADGHEPDRMMWIAISAREDTGGSARGGMRLSRNLSRLSPASTSGKIPNATEIRHDGTSPFTARSAECRVLVWQSHPVTSRSRMRQPDIERANRSLPNFLACECQNRAHPRPRQWLWLARDSCASCPLLQRCSPNFLPLGCAHSSRKQETPVCTVLHCVSVLRMQRFKPLPQTSHRGRE